MTASRPRFARACLLPLLAFVVIVAVPAAAQDQMGVEGTIQSIFGQTLTLLSDAPINRGQAILSPSLVPLPAPRPTLTVDLDQLPASQYVFLRPGERVAVVGVVSKDGRRLTATSLTGGAGPQSP